MAAPAAPANGLIVPVRVEALRIGSRDATQASAFLPPYADFSKLPWKQGTKLPYLGRYLLNAPFTGNAPLAQGIHLHWHLPRGLRQGEADDQGVLTMPVVPNRWLVTRIAVDLKDSRNPATTLRNWVVESDYLAMNSAYSGTVIPYSTSGRSQPFRSMGRVYDLEDWLANGGKGTYYAGLTAMGFGIPDFSSYYPNCRAVFGLLDDTLNDPKVDYTTVRFAYAVAGWYDDPANDPCAGGALDGTDNRYGWLFHDGDAPPTYSLFSGAVEGVTWDSNPNKAYLPDWKTRIAPDVAIGNTPMEAVSAWAAKAVAGQPGLRNVERLLNALQIGALSALDSPGGLARIEEELFNRSFASADGGTLWDIVPRDSQAAGGNIPSADGTLLGQLGRLNGVQKQANTLNAQAQALQTQIFCDWNKYMVVRYPVGTPVKMDVNRIVDYISREIAALTDIQSAIADADAEILRLADRMRAGLPDGLELVSVPGPRWSAPNDPVVLLTGDHVPPAPPDAAKTIGCVTTRQLCDALSLPAGLVPGSRALSIDVGGLPSVAGRDRLPFPAAAALVPVVALTAPSIAAVPVKALAGQGGAGNPALLDFAATVGAVTDAQTALLADQQPTNGITLSGSLLNPPIALRPWASPWNPIALSWQADYRPVARTGSGGAYQDDYVVANFSLDDATLDLTINASAEFSPQIQSYNGTVLLSSDALISLQTEINRYLPYAEGEFEQELREILDELGAQPILAQSLGGFHEALVMLSETMQLPVADPLAPDPGTLNFTKGVADAVAGRNGTAPVPDFSYSPLRAGKLTFRQISLIDSFGQFRMVNVSEPVVSETIPVTPEHPPALLTPLRVAQDSRLDFDLRAAADPALAMSSLPDSTPICGWVVPNHLDRGLMFYDGDGTAIGTLLAAGGGVVWQDAPDAGPARQGIEDAFRGRNPVLTGIALAVYEGGTDYLTALIRSFDRTRTTVSPTAYQQDRQTAVLLGTPLAIVQASLGLGLMGAPRPNQSYGALQADMDRPFPPDGPRPRTTDGFADLRYPVTLGSVSLLNDGLYGFFMPGAAPEGQDFSVFYAAGAEGNTLHVVVPEDDTIALAFSAPRPLVITMLVDPRSPVHAFSGIGPVVTAAIPQNFYAAALDSLSFVFLCSPVLALPSGLSLPLPTETDGSWSWVDYARGAWATRAVGPVDDRATLQAPGRILEGWLKLTGKEGNT